MFNGIKFRRYPDSKHKTHRSYFSPGGTDRQRGIGALHQEIWKAAHGPIPAGHHIHHVDENPLNNELSNLGCVPMREHFKHHNSEFTPARKRAQQLATKAARAWHRSAEGLAWHRKHAMESIHKPKT